MSAETAASTTVGHCGYCFPLGLGWAWHTAEHWALQEACAHARIGPSLRVVRAGSHRRAARARGGACDCAHGPIGLGGKPPHLVVVVLRLRANVRLDLFAVPAAVLTGRAPSVEQSAQCSCGHRIRACTHAPVRTCGLQRIRCSGQRAWLRYCSLRSMIMDRSNICKRQRWLNERHDYTGVAIL